MNTIYFQPNDYLSESYSKDKFASDIIRGLGLTPTPERLLFMLSWFQAEGMKSEADNVAYNPLATTLKTPNSTFYNCLKKDSEGNCLIGVQDYPDYHTGLYATLKTLNQSDYANIRKLLHDNPSAIAESDTGLEKDFRTWGTTYDLFKKVYASKGGKIVKGSVPQTTGFARNNKKIKLDTKPLMAGAGLLGLLFFLDKQIPDKRR